MFRRLLSIYVTLFVIMGYGGSYSVAATTPTPKPATTPYTEYQDLMLFGDVYEKVKQLYVSPVVEQELIENALHGMVSSLDPHSDYLDSQQTADLDIVTSGQFGGLGIEVTSEDNFVKIVSPLDGTPAFKAGLLPGDIILRVDGESIYKWGLTKTVNKMRGEVGEPITLTIARKGAKKLLDFKLKRDVIKVVAVKSNLDKDVGVLHLTTFSKNAAADLKSAIVAIKSKLNDKDIKGYILDLRLNPGGLVNQAVAVADLFLNNGEVVSTRGKIERNNQQFYATSGDILNGKPLVVLINGGSASASEIVAGALQDHKRATILGTRSFGKGSVQTIIPLSKEGSSLRLTTALYYTPSGKSIQGHGIVPDILVKEELPKHLKSEYVTIGESDLRGHIKGNEENSAGSGSVAYVAPKAEDDTQLQAALQLLRGQVTKDQLLAKVKASESALAQKDKDAMKTEALNAEAAIKAKLFISDNEQDAATDKDEAADKKNTDNKANDSKANDSKSATGNETKKK